MLSSFPHFYKADKSLLEQIDGLNPRQEDHETYIDLHPVCLGVLPLKYYYVKYYYDYLTVNIPRYQNINKILRLIILIL